MEYLRSPALLGLEIIARPSFVLTVPERKARMLCACHPVASCICLIDAPDFPRKSFRSNSRFEEDCAGLLDIDDLRGLGTVNSMSPTEKGPGYYSRPAPGQLASGRNGMDASFAAEVQPVRTQKANVAAHRQATKAVLGRCCFAAIMAYRASRMQRDR